MSRDERLAVISAQLQELERQLGDAACEAALNMGGWRKLVDGAWLEKALTRISLLKAYVDQRRRGIQAPSVAVPQ